MNILPSPSLEILAFDKTNYMTSGCQNDVYSHFKLNCSEKSNFEPFQLKEKLFRKAYLLFPPLQKKNEPEYFISKRPLNSAVHTTL